MDIVLTYSTLRDTVKRSLSIIGKRSVDDKGNLLFKDITIGSNEEKILDDFFDNAVNELVAEFGCFVTGYDSDITLTFPSNWNSNLEEYVNTTCESFLVAYALHSWFVVTAPRIAEKYQTEMSRQLASLVRMMYEKKAPASSSKDYTSTSVSVTPTYQLFKQGDNYYRWAVDNSAMTQLSAAEVGALTPEQKAQAVVIPTAT